MTKNKESFKMYLHQFENIFRNNANSLERVRDVKGYKLYDENTKPYRIDTVDSLLDFLQKEIDVLQNEINEIRGFRK